jgi:hypothetical protein
MVALNHLGYDPLKEVPIVTKIKSDIKKFNDKNQVITRIKELEREFYYKIDKKQFIWSEEDQIKLEKSKANSLNRGASTIDGKKSKQIPSKSIDSVTISGGGNIIFEPISINELNKKSARNNLDLHDSLQVMNAYLIEDAKAQAKKEKVSISAVPDYTKSPSQSSKFLAKLVRSEGGSSTAGDATADEYFEELVHSPYALSESMSQADLADPSHHIGVIFEEGDSTFDTKSTKPQPV